MLFVRRWKRNLDCGERTLGHSEDGHMCRQTLNLSARVRIVQQEAAVAADAPVVSRAEQEGVEAGYGARRPDTANFGALADTGSVLGGIGHDEIAVSKMRDGVLNAASKARQFVMVEVNRVAESRVEITIVDIADRAGVRQVIPAVRGRGKEMKEVVETSEDPPGREGY